MAICLSLYLLYLFVAQSSPNPASQLSWTHLAHLLGVLTKHRLFELIFRQKNLTKVWIVLLFCDPPFGLNLKMDRVKDISVYYPIHSQACTTIAYSRTIRLDLNFDGLLLYGYLSRSGLTTKLLATWWRFDVFLCPFFKMSQELLLIFAQRYGDSS